MFYIYEKKNIIAEFSFNVCNRTRWQGYFEHLSSPRFLVGFVLLDLKFYV